MKAPKVDATRKDSSHEMSSARGAQMNAPISKVSAGPGRLFVVGMPIGHPGDLTLRARRILRGVGIIASEDPQVTHRLLARYRITVPVTTYFPGNHREKTAVLLQHLAQGQDIALVTDAGTPAVFDPGAYLVRAAHRAGVSVMAVPGPSILTAALSVAGCEGERVLFMGRLPPSHAARRELFRRARALADTHVVLLDPQDVPRLVREVHGWEGNRKMVILRNLTTASEEIRPTTTERFLRSVVYESSPALVTVVFAGMTRRARGLTSRSGKRRQGKRVRGATHPSGRAAG